MGLLTVGTDLSNRKVTLSLPSGTTISDYKVVARGYSNCYIYEDSTGVYWVTPNHSGILPSNNNTIHEEFGVITEIDETAVSYPYLSRVDNEKVYVHSEDLGRVELKTKTFSTTLATIAADSVGTIIFDLDSIRGKKIIGITTLRDDDKPDPNDPDFNNFPAILGYEVIDIDSPPAGTPNYFIMVIVKNFGSTALSNLPYSATVVYLDT